MQNNHPTFTYAYHFLSEAIIIFLIVLPIMHHSYEWVPYGSYLAMITGICIVYTAITRQSTNYFWYLLTIPFLFALFYLLNYPIMLAVLFPVLFVWRYIDIRKEEIISRENTYILITVILTAIISLLVNDTRIMLYPFLQFIILIIGYITSHLAVVHKMDRKQFNNKLPVYFIGVLAVGAGLFYLLFDVTRLAVLATWQGLLNLFGSALGGVANVLSFLDVQQRGWPEQTREGEGFAGDGYWKELDEKSIIEMIAPYVLTILLITLIVFGVILVILLWKRRFNKKLDPTETDETISYSALDDKSKKKLFSLDSMKHFFKKPDHPIRKMVLEFERKAIKNKKGRKHYETIEDWFSRIGMNTDIAVYQKVRYGEIREISERDRNAFKEQLDEMKGRLEEKDSS
ncbi:hypothetical protein QGM71_16005 [Virgibacillus sp. C22-A2]|uniref:DUF4129 domain-containing protein n=1 Tax=Virgibacillus tibetensis TaxID=3042313 RepID=A0ABU6KI44_9BACI|nr:hypothetical protein [Virgibacillus sp. C22-A2]